MIKKRSAALGVIAAVAVSVGSAGTAQAALTVYDKPNFTVILYSGSGTYADLWDDKMSSADNLTSWKYRFYNQVLWTETVIATIDPGLMGVPPASADNMADHLRR